jgi:hypothetical protein
MWNFQNCFELYFYTCVVFLWLIPHPIVIWLIYGSKECNKHVIYVICYPSATPLANIPLLTELWRYGCVECGQVAATMHSKNIAWFHYIFSETIVRADHCYIIFQKHKFTFTVFLRSDHSMDIVRRYQEFWVTDAGKRHLEERCIRYNCTLFTWSLFRDQIEVIDICGEQFIRERWIKVSLYIHCTVLSFNSTAESLLWRKLVYVFVVDLMLLFSNSDFIALNKRVISEC